MADEPQDQAQDQTKAAPAAPAEEAVLDRGSYEESLKATSGMAAKAAAGWLSKLMPGKKVDGVQLDGLGKLDPTTKKIYDDYIGKEMHADSRRLLTARITTWMEVLKDSEDTSEAADELDEKIDALQALFEENQASALEAIQPLEKTYRMLDSFYTNAQVEAGDKVDAWLFNSTADGLMDPDDKTNYEALAENIQEAYRSFSMRKNYGMLVVPGWLGDVKQVDRLSTLAHQNKLMAVTDGPDLDTANKLIEYMSSDAFASMLGNDPEKRNVALYCNYLVARSKNKVEDEHLYVPPSFHAAGAMYRGDLKDGIHQSRAGFKHGKLQNAVKARFKVDRPKATALMTKHGLNAIVDWDGYPTVVGDQNLCNQEGMNSYSKIRTEDWIVKNVLNFLNYQAFQSINDKNLQTWKSAIYSFLDSICDRHGNNVIQGFDVNVTSSDEDRRKNQVNVQVSVKYQHMVRYFNLRVRDKNGKKEAQEEDGAE